MNKKIVAEQMQRVNDNEENVIMGRAAKQTAVEVRSTAVARASNLHNTHY